MFDIVFDPNQPPGHPTAQAETSRGAGGFNIPGVVRVFPFGFAQPFSSLVHTVAHEIEHIHQVMQGIASEPVREFLSEGIEIESIGMPTEAIESDADIDLIVRDKLPVNPGFLKDADRMLHFWGQMTPAEKQTHHQRFKDIRSIIVSRIATEASASQQRKLATFVRNFQAADAAVP